MKFYQVLLFFVLFSHSIKADEKGETPERAEHIQEFIKSFKERNASEISRLITAEKSLSYNALQWAITNEPETAKDLNFIYYTTKIFCDSVMEQKKKEFEERVKEMNEEVKMALKEASKTIDWGLGGLGTSYLLVYFLDRLIPK